MLSSADADIVRLDPSIPGLAHLLADEKMQFLPRALSAREVERGFRNISGFGSFQVTAIRVMRYKPGRRCLIEYDLESQQSNATCGITTLIGKVRATGADKRTYRLVTELNRAGVRSEGNNRVCVPEPIGLLPELHMWLQRKVAGETATRLLAEADGARLAGRIAEAIYEFHRAGVPTNRRHTMADELRILYDRLTQFVHRNPHWGPRIERILSACVRVATAAPEQRNCGIHRDFYADQVIVDGAHVYLVDLDLYCQGDPALDVGNFNAHLIEQSLRTFGSPEALVDQQNALVEQFIELSGESSRTTISAYTNLSLVRHIHLSSLFSERQPFTGAIMELCERRLGIPRRA